ncbi:lysylphosphatidylglycerol synthase transmembrane domain-containing protein [Haloarcula marina]|uniref:lysylphosphatidylglycerol synthase transmembrane domain-containing protein n=1 Tax=Haloarcula marina TaxID=2961574 RepID=UPI0020B8CFD7|nr:lysylphosphatidylglycerol synthase domain-containing protein [Halomicroarcula marina]
MTPSRRNLARFLLGSTLGVGALAAYLRFVGTDAVLARASTIAPAALALVACLVVAEAVVDGIGVWASVRPLGGGLSSGKSVQFAFAGDFFDTLSPAGPVSSEPIMARFIGVATETTYSEALGVRGVAKYVKSGAQLFVSTALAVVLLAGQPSASAVVTTLGGALVGLLVVGALLVRSRAVVSTGLVAVLAPVVRVVSSLYRERPHDRAAVADAVSRFTRRVGQFRDRPGLLVLIALGGVLEQLLTATALWVALSGTGTAVPLLPIVALVPLPQAASAVPVPASIGAYDVLLSGGLALVTGVPAAETAAPVLVVRALSIPLALGVGGVAVAFLRGWRPGAQSESDAD